MAAEDTLQTEANADRQFASAKSDRDDLASQVEKLMFDMHMVKGNLAANTSITMETASAIDAIKVIIGKIDVDKIAQLVGVVDDMKGGVRVLGWLERPAKWIAAVASAVGGVWLAWHKFKD